MKAGWMYGATVTLASVFVVLAACETAEARPRRRNAAQIKAMQEQAAYMQLEMIRYQAEMARVQQQIYASFDQDGDGALGPDEKFRYDKQMRDIQNGKAANPFASILPVGQGLRPKSPIDELKQRSQQFQADVVAKQQEIFRSFDENGSGELEGAEKSKFNRHMHAIETGKAPNPFAPLAAPDHAKSGADAK